MSYSFFSMHGVLSRLFSSFNLVLIIELALLLRDQLVESVSLTGSTTTTGTTAFDYTSASGSLVGLPVTQSVYPSVCLSYARTPKVGSIFFVCSFLPVGFLVKLGCSVHCFHLLNPIAPPLPFCLAPPCCLLVSWLSWWFQFCVSLALFG